MRKPDGQTVFLASVIAASIIVLGALAFFHEPANGDRGAAAGPTLQEIPFDGQRSYQWLAALCALGPRPSGGPGMARQQEMLASHFSRLGGRVRLDRFTTRHPVDGRPVEMANLIVEWHPERLERILICTHYDTRPYPDEDPDPRRRRDPFLGANDGGSGTALLCELGRRMPQFQSRYGVDFAFFDAEEFVFNKRRDPYFLGSEHFARNYAAQPPPYRYRGGVLLDMIGDAELQIYQEVNSMRWRDTRPLTKSIWATAARLGVRDFISRTRHEVRDDHVPLHDIAKIPTCDIIDFDYPRPGRLSYWHTTADTLDKCSALSLAKVGWVLMEWLSGLDREAGEAPNRP